jgi:predicted enzyme related to lactoylglutathione lyase
MPTDQGIQDVAHWQLRLRVANLEGIRAQAETYGGTLISPGIVELGEQAELIGSQRALQLADPDGHRIQVLQA